MAFPTVTVLDSFKREETPLEKGNGTIPGAWETFFIASGGVGHCVSNTDWENHASEDIEGAYWSVSTFSAPTGVAITRDRRMEDGGTWFVMACITAPTTTEISGYRLTALRTGGSGSTAKFTVKLERCDKHIFTVLHTMTEEVIKEGDRMGLAVQAGKVEYYRKVGGGAWEERASGNDATYSSGYSAFGVINAGDGNTTNFEAGPEESGTPVVENPGTRHSTLGKPVSLQIHSTFTTEYKAEGLPEGLSINEGTGLITGTPTKLESTKVTIKVKGPEGTDETEFEWIIEEAGAHKKNKTFMVL